MQNITFQQLHTFFAVAETLNLSAAANNLYISQPALSKTISRLENTLGMRLFNRHSKGLTLTESGAYLYAELKNPYLKIASAIETAQHMYHGAKRQLRIGYPSSFDCNEDFDIVRETVEKFRRLHPDIDVVEVLYEFVPLRNALNYSEVDIIIGQMVLSGQLEGISLKKISPFHMYIAMSAEHPLAASESIDLSMLENETFHEVFCYTATEDEQKHLKDAWGFSPKVKYVPNLLTLMRALSQQKGISCCGKITGVANASELKYIPLPKESSLAVSSITAIWRTDDLSPAARNLLDMFPEYTE